MMLVLLLALLALLPGCGPVPVARAAPARVELIATPNGGIQPQAVVDSRGTLHLIYFKGGPAGGDLYYVRRAAGSAGFSAPLRVNSQAGSAIAIGTIRGGQIALGRNGRVHVVWNGSGQASPRGPGGGAPLLYGRLNGAGTAFEPQRNLLHTGFNLDGGGSVAADTAGNVYAVWHAAASPNAGEQNRCVWIARSADDGATFTKEAPVSAQSIGACGCCGLKALAARDGAVFVLYRAATQRVERGIQLLTSRDRGQTFQARPLDRWPVDT
jgi:hypothetical protein